MAGIVIGMTPIAALVSTILYSWWTSHSYKAALIFASGCSVLGNSLYALGLPYGSLTLVLVGRLLNGFGSARAINRRYIADSFAREERTAASAAFVTAGALGMAAGPALAAGLDIITPEDEAWWSVENAPGTLKHQHCRSLS
jgi:MFS family permease